MELKEMSKAIRSDHTNNDEAPKIAKYIVEAPEPKKGQKVSSGGIRENGKLTAQFKNPVQYKEPPLPPVVVTQEANHELALKEQARARRDETGRYLLGLIWQEFGEPLIRSSLRKLSNTIINKIEGDSGPTSTYVTLSDPVVIDVEADEIDNVYDDDKIISLLDRQAN